VIAALLLAAGVQASPPVFEASVEKVYVDAFITRRGRAVRGLKQENFELRDNGVVQKVELVALQQAPLTVVLALDTSRSVEGAMLAVLRAAGHALVDGLPPSDHVAVLAFSHRIARLASATADRSAIHRAIDGLEAMGATALRDGLYAAMRLPVPDNRRAVVVFSDGADNRSWLSAEDVREASRRTGAMVYAVCRTGHAAATPTLFGSPPQLETGAARELRLLAESTGGMFMEAADPAAVRERFQRVLEEMGTRYLLAFVPTVGGEGEHRLEVKVRGGRGTVRSRRSYVVPRRETVTRPASGPREPDR
jgi:tight adherence protein B